MTGGLGLRTSRLLRTDRLRALALGLLILPASCGKGTEEHSAGLMVAGLRNAKFRSEWPKDGVAKLVDGAFQERYPDSALALRIWSVPNMISFGDLNGDGVSDAVVILATHGGGTGVFMTLEAVINDNGTPKHVATAGLGDRTRVRSVVIESGEITVGLVTHGPDDPMFRPTVEVTRRYRLRDTSLEDVGVALNARSRRTADSFGLRQSW